MKRDEIRVVECTLGLDEYLIGVAFDGKGVGFCYDFILVICDMKIHTSYIKNIQE